jgi:spore germination cell wall hydrolase CwlJ-like protein
MKRLRLQSVTAGAIATLMMLTGCGTSHRQSEYDCMARAMYFESIRSSRDGMIAVGSVVMNCVDSDSYPGNVCGVVGQKGQFAPGVMSRKMDDKSARLVREAAVAVLRGERHPLIAQAQFFHSAGYRASYDNMHYVLVAGGNAFYERRKPHLVTQPSPPAPIENITGR